VEGYTKPSAELEINVDVKYAGVSKFFYNRRYFSNFRKYLTDFKFCTVVWYHKIQIKFEFQCDQIIGSKVVTI
jgi:hypothetical protein